MLERDQPIIITIDGPTASGKGTVARTVAERLGLHYLDSGSLYRLTALDASHQGIDRENANLVANVASKMDVSFRAGRIYLSGCDVTEEIRTESIGEWASRVSAYPPVREALLGVQRSFACGPGLVADGRDMGTTIFPQASLKIFLTASPEIRANRRFLQLEAHSESVSYDTVLADLRRRDERDSGRSTSPLMPAHDAIYIDSSDMSAEDVISRIIGLSEDLTVDGMSLMPKSNRVSP